MIEVNVTSLQATDKSFFLISLVNETSLHTYAWQQAILIDFVNKVSLHEMIICPNDYKGIFAVSFFSFPLKDAALKLILVFRAGKGSLGWYIDSVLVYNTTSFDKGDRVNFREPPTLKQEEGKYEAFKISYLKKDYFFTILGNTRRTVTLNFW